MYIKVTPGNEVVGIQKHTLYVISYKLPWVLRPKNTIIRNSPFLLRDQRYFLLSSIIIAHWGELCLPYSSAFLACKYNSFIRLDWPKTVMWESKKYR